MIFSDDNNISDDDEEYIPLKKRLKGLIGIVDLTSVDDIPSPRNSYSKHIDLTINDNDDGTNIAIPRSYAKLRKDRMNDSRWNLFRHPRGSKLTIIRNWLESKRVAITINESTVKSFISQCLNDFQRMPLKFREILMNHSRKQLLIDQDIWDACSFVAYSHLKWLSDGGPIWDKHWLRTWRKLSPDGGPFEDLGSMLDQLKNFESLSSKLRYIPFRTSDENENRFNTDLPYTTGLDFRTPYERIGAFFEKALDQGTPVAFNQAQHSRVAIAYNDQDILCIDSFPRLYAEEHEYMYFCGGVSTVKKEFVYQWVRDAIIYSD